MFYIQLCHLQPTVWVFMMLAGNAATVTCLLPLTCLAGVILLSLFYHPVRILQHSQTSRVTVKKSCKRSNPNQNMSLKMKLLSSGPTDHVHQVTNPTKKNITSSQCKRNAKITFSNTNVDLFLQISSLHLHQK